MNINFRNISIIYLFLYISLLVGFYFNEDFTLGSKIDYLSFRNNIFLSENDFVYSLLNFDKLSGGHPLLIYQILLLFLEKMPFSENFTRLIFLHFSLLLPFFLYLCLKIKYEFKANDIKILLPTIIFFSPYFRSASIWLLSENISLIFLSISLYFFLKYEKTEKKKIIFYNSEYSLFSISSLYKAQLFII